MIAAPRLPCGAALGALGMLTTRTLSSKIPAASRRVGVALTVLGAVMLSACGGDIPLTHASAPGATATISAAGTATPGPASIKATLTGDARVSGPLVLGSTHFVTCDAPSLQGETIFAFENATDPAIGVLLTIRSSAIEVRLAQGSGTTYTERLFDGSRVTSFNPAGGATFASSLTETTPGTSNKGTLGSISSISGSVSCGTFTPGSGSVTVAGDTAGGTLSSALTPVRVLCGTNTAGSFVTVSGLSTVGSTPALVSVLGGLGGATFYVVVQTASATYQYSSATAGIITLSGGTATYNGTATEITASGGATGRSVTVSGTATCGT
jgi:hypothetical protein